MKVGGNLTPLPPELLQALKLNRKEVKNVKSASLVEGSLQGFNTPVSW